MDVEEILALVKEYTEGKLRLENSFTVYIDRKGYVEDLSPEAYRGSVVSMLDFQSRRIIIDGKKLGLISEKTTPATIASLLSFHQPAAYMYEKREVPEEKIKRSKLLPGLCKFVEVKTIKEWLEPSGLSLNVDMISPSRKEPTPFKEELEGIVAGRQIAEKIVSKIPPHLFEISCRTFPGCRQADLVIKAICDHISSHESLDLGLRRALELVEKHGEHGIDELFVVTGHAIFRGPIDIREIEKIVKELYPLMGENRPGGEVKSKINELIDSLERAGAPKKLQDSIEEMFKSLEKHASDELPLRNLEKTMIRKGLKNVEAYLKSVKESPGEYIYVY